MSAREYQMMVGLEVLDEARYAEYRAGMKPILHGMGGRFVCDFRVSDVLDVDVTRREGEAALDARINRVFVLGFPDESVKERFFGDAGYGEVKKEFFASSVGCVAAIFEE